MHHPVVKSTLNAFLYIRGAISKQMKKLLSAFYILSFFGAATAQDTLSVMYYNLLRFPNANITAHEDTLRKVIQHVQPDVLAACEIVWEYGADTLLNQSLNVNGISHYQRATYYANTSGTSNTENMIFYNTQKLSLKSQSIIETDTRDINEYTLFYNSPDLATTGDTIFLDFYVAHLKAGSTASDSSRRKLAIDSLRKKIDANPSALSLIHI